MGPPTFVVVLIIASIVLFILCIFLSIGCSIWYQMKYSREKRQYKLAKKLNKHQTPMVMIGGTDPVIGPEQGGIGWNAVDPSPPVAYGTTHHLHVKMKKPKKFKKNKKLKKWGSLSSTLLEATVRGMTQPAPAEDNA